MRDFLVTCFLFVHSLAEVWQKLDQCSCKKSSGKIISLWEIDGGSKPAFKDIVTTSPPGTRFLFDWNPCTKFSEGDGCQGVLMCQTDPDVAGVTSPCADSVADFKVEDDGTTTIEYHELTDKSDYKRFFVSLIVYVIGGIMINKLKMGVESMPEMCPNYQFWAGIPSLIKDGVVFSCSSIRSACSSLYQKCNKDSYAKL